MNSTNLNKYLNLLVLELFITLFYSCLAYLYGYTNKYRTVSLYIIFYVFSWQNAAKYIKKAISF